MSYTVKKGEEGTLVVEATVAWEFRDEEDLRKYLADAKRVLDQMAETDFRFWRVDEFVENGVPKELAERIVARNKALNNVTLGVNAMGVEMMLVAMAMLHADGYNGASNRPKAFFKPGRGAERGSHVVEFDALAGLPDKEDEDEG